jgi:hypothetical protein
MESLFSTNIKTYDKNVVYQVYFDQEKYIFSPDEKDNMQPLPPELKMQAINALENYLLAQH